MAEIKRIAVRFNLDEDEQDKELWNVIQQKKKKNDYIKTLIRAGIQQQEQQSILEKVMEIKNMLENLKRGGMSSYNAHMETESHLQQTNGSYAIIDPKEEVQNETMVMENAEDETTSTQTGMAEAEHHPVIDADVMNFLDNL